MKLTALRERERKKERQTERKKETSKKKESNFHLITGNCVEVNEKGNQFDALLRFIRPDESVHFTIN